MGVRREGEGDLRGLHPPAAPTDALRLFAFRKDHVRRLHADAPSRIRLPGRREDPRLPRRVHVRPCVSRMSGPGAWRDLAQRLPPEGLRMDRLLVRRAARRRQDRGCGRAAREDSALRPRRLDRPDVRRRRDLWRSGRQLRALQRRRRVARIPCRRLSAHSGGLGRREEDRRRRQDEEGDSDDASLPAQGDRRGTRRRLLRREGGTEVSGCAQLLLIVRQLPPYRPLRGCSKSARR